MLARTVSLRVQGQGDSLPPKEALHAQQELLQKLRHDLDVEREASATAASEALSMILRLQGEKAALEMDNSQYKRIAEEKMCHAETSLAIFEDLIYQKEMEIASLEFQVQAYRCKLLSLGCRDVRFIGNKFPVNMMFQKNDTLLSADQSCGCGGIQRPRSLPAIPLDALDEKKGSAEDFSLMDKEVVDQSSEQNKSREGSPSPRGDLNSCWAQIKNADERAREGLDLRDSQKEKHTVLESCALFSQLSTGILESARSDIANIMDKMKNVDRMVGREAAGSDTASSSSNVQDIFEVPQATGCERASSDDDQPEKADLSVERQLELGNIKTVPHKTCPERKSDKPPTYRSRGDSIMTTDYQAELNQLKERIGRLEGENISSRHEISVEDNREQLSLLKEIRDQIELVRSDMRHPRLETKQPLPQDDIRLLSLKEAMIYFWF